jgi:hypothetical protein
MSFEEAIRLVQIHERARQGRLRAKFMREIRRQEEIERQAQTRGAPTLDPDVAATRIQKVYHSPFNKVSFVLNYLHKTYEGFIFLHILVYTML